MSSLFRSDHSTRTQELRRRSLGRPRRKGVLTVFVLLFIFIAILMMMLVLNWIWLVLYNRDMQRRSDLLALVAAPELLDEQLLQDRPHDQADDAIDAEYIVDVYRKANNRVTSPALRVNRSNVTVKAGRIDNVELPHFAQTPPYNSVRVALHRFASGPNPARLLIRGFGTPDAVDVTTVSIATLDSRVIGFRPTSTVAAPLVPLAIDTAAWFEDRCARARDSNDNNRYELDVVLRSSSGEGAANAALIDLDEAQPIHLAVIPDQVTDGTWPIDLTHPICGPASPDQPLVVPALQTSPTNTRAILDAFNTVSDRADRRRVFPLYDGDGGESLGLVGFVAATVLSAQNIGGDENRLSVTVEPTFLVHSTAVTTTDPRVRENIYIHKLRLVK